MCKEGKFFPLKERLLGKCLHFLVTGEALSSRPDFMRTVVLGSSDVFSSSKRSSMARGFCVTWEWSGLFHAGGRASFLPPGTTDSCLFPGG